MIRRFQSREFPTLPIAGGIAASVDFDVSATGTTAAFAL